MATKKPKVVARRKAESVRERAEKVQKKKAVEPRRRKVATAAAKPAKGLKNVLVKEYHPIKLPDNKAGRALTKRRSWVPTYFIASWRELRQVVWPTKRQAASLTFAVIAFSVAIAIIVRILDYGFEKLFRGVILK